MNEEGKNRSNTLLLTVIAIATLLVAVIGATFAYFTANTAGTETASTINVTATQLSVTFADGSGSVVVANQSIEPSNTALVTKDFTVTGVNNTSNNNSAGLYMPYTLSLVVNTNTFVLQNAVTGTSISFRMVDNSSTDTGVIPDTPANTYVKVGSTVASKTVAANLIGASQDQTANAYLQAGVIETDNSANNVKVDTNHSAKGVWIGRGYFAPKNSGSSVHHYTLTVYFMEDGTNQDIDKSSTFQGYIDCSTSTEALTTTNTAVRNSALDFTA